MPKVTLQQIREAIQGSGRIVIALPESPSLDAVASGIVLAEIIEKLGKTVNLVSHGFHANGHFAALTGLEKVLPELPKSAKSVISVKLDDTSIEELSYEVQDGTLQIYVTPKGGPLQPDHVSVHSAADHVDLIITLEAHDLNSLGALYTANNELFNGATVVNIDYRPLNTMFGQMAYLDTHAASIAEIIHGLLQGSYSTHLTAQGATNLLASIMATTQCFQSPMVSTKTLAIASELIAKGAEYAKTLEAIFAERSIEVLRLWGRVFARLQRSMQGRFVWSRIQAQDFEKSQTTKEQLPRVMDELARVSRHAAVIAILYQTPAGNIEAMVRTLPTMQPHALFSMFPSEEHEDVAVLRFETSSLESAEQELVAAAAKTIT